jgi:hypothetical protein
MPALPPKADIGRGFVQVRLVPIDDIAFMSDAICVVLLEIDYLCLTRVETFFCNDSR